MTFRAVRNRLSGDNSSVCTAVRTWQVHVGSRSQFTSNAKRTVPVITNKKVRQPELVKTDSTPKKNRGESKDDVQDFAPLRPARDDCLDVAEIKSFVFFGK